MLQSSYVAIKLVSRTERLLNLIQLLRRYQRPVSGAVLASELGISIRSLYRDIATLQAQGASIDGAPGLGYVLRPGYVLPPLMFSREEIDALVLGSRWVADRGDKRLAMAARDALAKIASVLPHELRRSLETCTLMVGPGEPIAAGDAELALIRQSIRQERKLVMTYRSAANEEVSRTVWPLAIGFFDRARVLVAWCELRQAIRHFRTDRIVEISSSESRYPQRRQALLKEWREREGIPE